MRFLFTSDIHASRSHLFSMLKKAERKSATAVVIGGDIVPHYLPDFENRSILEAQSLYLQKILIPAMEKYKEKNRGKIFLDMGNDDFIAGRKILEARRGELFELLHMKVQKFTDQVDIVGYMNVPPTPFGRKDWEKPDSKSQPFAPGNRITLRGMISHSGRLEKTILELKSEDSIETDLEILESKIRRPFILVCHAPPYGTGLDVMYNGSHVGSLAVRKFIERWAKKKLLIASFHGHIHESYTRSGTGMDTLLGTPCFNPGQGNGPGAKFRSITVSLKGQKIRYHRVLFT